MTPEQRDELIEFARANDLWVITDEVYDRIVYDSEHVSFLGAGYDKVIMINSFSKTFAMTGWRIGYILSPDLEAMGHITKMQYYVTACSNDVENQNELESLLKSKDPKVLLANAKEKQRIGA